MTRIVLSALALAAACALAGCAPMAQTSRAAPPPPPGPCNAPGASWAIGRAVDQELVNRVIHDTGSRVARVVEPGQPVTMDYNPERVSILLNERGAITGIDCG